ncbi:GNAT family N-acetyltransferase [Streptomyces sp. NPDC058412]|uniref:GNAT family N-acetyltransferase n=1 Tax=Streptomyces sp. NPDC058412 TaxID=3346486 RepID=UPI0036501076
MTERTIHLDPEPRDWRSRKIRVRPSRWYATVELDRDGYVTAERSRGRVRELPAAYVDAVHRVRSASIDCIWYDGYSEGFSWGGEPGWVTLFVQFPHVEAAVSALRIAELDHDYSGLHALAERLVLPVDDWLAPGERELIRGVDFAPPPNVFLKFLRGKAKERGVRLNGRATTGSVWVRPMLSPAQKLVCETSPERYPGWVDRWTEHVDADDAPLRPWVGARGENLSHGAEPVQFRAAETPAIEKCPCGMRLGEAEYGGQTHALDHAAWAFGARVPKNLEWRADLAVVTTQSAVAWRKLAYQVARLPQRENHYDFPSWSHLGEPKVTPDNVRAYLLQTNGSVIGYLNAYDTDKHRHWDLADGSPYGDEDETLRPVIGLVWVADAYRRQGVGATIVQALADDFGCQVADVSWSSPISDAGRRLARRISPSGVWVS